MINSIKNLEVFPPLPPRYTLTPRTTFYPKNPHPNSTLNPKVNVKTTMPNTTFPLLPRVGGIKSDMAWTGGSNNNPAGDPQDVRCFRPSDFCSMQK